MHFLSIFIFSLFFFLSFLFCFFFFFQAEDGIRDLTVTGYQTCALPIFVAEGYQIFGVGADVVALTNYVRDRVKLISDHINQLPPAQRPPASPTISTSPYA